MTEIYISDDKLAELTQAAIFEYLTPEKKDQLVKEAIAALLEKPSRDHALFGRGTRLQEAFAQSMGQIVEKEVSRLVKEDAEIGAQIEKLVRNALTDTLTSDRVSQNLGYAIAKVLAGEP